MDQSLAVVDAEVTELAVRRAPAEVLEEATRAAQALQKVLAAKPKKVTFNGEQYLEFEDWQTIGRFYGITVKVIDVQFVTYGSVQGFSAKAVAIRSDGMEISAAEAECLNDEEKWSTRAKYEWRKKADGNGNEKVKVSEERVPLFQLKSMAQTRACSKAFRNVLAWVVVMAGYRPTPAEELPTEQHDNNARPVSSDGATPAAGGPRVAGMLYVDEVTPKPAEGKPGHVKVSDGRKGSTFDAKAIDIAMEAHEKGLPVHVEFKDTVKGDRTYTNLAKIEFVKAAEAQLPMEDTEPVGTPEGVLMVKKIDQDGGKFYFAVQTDKRQYRLEAFGALAQDAVVVMANDASKMSKSKGKVKAKIAFSVEKDVKSGVPYNRIVEFGEYRDDLGGTDDPAQGAQ